MGRPPLTRPRRSARPNDGPRPGPPWRALLVVAIVLLNLACVTISTTWKVVHQEGQEDQVSITQSLHITDAYLDAVGRANTEREQDYRAAGQDVSDGGFPVTAEGASALLLGQTNDLQAKGFEVVEDSTGYVARASYTLAEFQETLGEEETVLLQVDRDRPEGIYYVFETELLESVDADDLEEIDRMRQDGPGPKPPPDPIDNEQIPEGSVVGGLAWIINAAGLTGTELDLWYARRILLEAGLPVSEYVVELPGQIVAHEVDGAEAGQVEGNRVKLVVDEAFWREFGPGEHRFRVEALVSVCEETCSGEPHWIWDGVSTYPECTCICEKGWEMTAAGCVDCQALCRQQDPPTEYDPANSEANRCACRPLPDRDGDGVPDESDACPDKPANTKDGCPTGGAVPGTPGESPPAAGSGPSPGQAAAAGGAAGAIAFIWTMMIRFYWTGRPAPGPARTRSTAHLNQPPLQVAPPPMQPAPPPTQLAQAAAPPARPPARPGRPPEQPSPPPGQSVHPSTQTTPPAQPAQPAPLPPAQQQALDRIERTLQNVGQTGTGQTRFSLEEIDELVPREYVLPAKPGESGEKVRNIKAQLDPSTGTITLRGDGPKWTIIRATIKPSVQGGEFRLALQEATVTSTLRDPFTDVVLVEASPIDVTMRLDPLRERLQQQVTEAIARRGARLQEVRIQADGIEISLQSQEAAGKP